MAKFKVNVAPGEASIEIEADRIMFNNNGTCLMKGGETVAFFPCPRSVVRMDITA